MPFDYTQFLQAAKLVERARLLRQRMQAANDLGQVRIDSNQDLDIPYTAALEALWTQRAQALFQQAKDIIASLG